MLEIIKIIVIFVSIGLAQSNRPPFFTKTIDLGIIKENTPIGTSVFQLLGSDPENSSLTYGLEGTDQLTVDKETGVITVTGNIDREKNDSLKFFITLEDIVTGEEANNLVRVPVTIIVIDVNDNPPVFHDLPAIISVREDTNPGVVVLEDITVTDLDDVGGVLQIQCESAQKSNECGQFAIDIKSAGSKRTMANLVVRKQLNFSEQQICQLILSAEDGYHKSEVFLNISVQDVQNLPPVFIGSLTGIVDEDSVIGTKVIKLLAEDGDVGNQRNIMYELVSNPEGLFSINAKNGEIRTKKLLDREQFSASNGIVNIVVKALEIESDGTLPAGKSEQWSSTAALSITIRDINDEAPVFNKAGYMVQINENVADGTPLPNLNMTIKDTDSGSNSVFNIELLDESNIFSIEPLLATGSTSVSIRVANGPLDYENPNQRKFILLVVAREAFTNPQLSTTGTVTVSITDINDNVPQFSKSLYKMTVLETAPGGTVIETITATDRDSGNFGEAGIVYSIFGNGADRFHVGSNTGMITVNQCQNSGASNCLDFEVRSVYSLSYQAVDEDGSGNAAIVPFIILLSDANDNAPSFLQDSYSATIDEGSTKFDLPLRIEAVDADPTSLLRYSIIAGNEQNLFSIDGRTGEIFVVPSNGLDVSSLKSNVVMLNVQASDGQSNVTTTVEVTIKDANNNRPVFEREEYDAVISESSLQGTVVEQVAATDSDTGMNAELTYRINSGGFDDFEIDSKSGIVTVSKQSKLDHDRRKTYSVVIAAVDGGTPSFTGTTTLSISILDSNDKAPYFTPTTQRTQISEGTEVGHKFYILSATDPDVISPDALSFAVAQPISAIDKEGKKITENSNALYVNFFEVIPSTGEVKVASKLDRELAAIVTLKVLVIDASAASPQTGTGTLVITIMDFNDHSPIFAPPWTQLHPYITVDMIEEQPLGSVVTTIVATDQDSNIASYRIFPSSPYFTIGNSSGIITVTSRIDYEFIPNVEFTVVVFDSGMPQLSASAFVKVNVININDNDPVFHQAYYHAMVKENSPQGTVVTRVTAEDADAGLSGKVIYLLLGEKKHDFHIDEMGVIKVAAAATLDHETTHTITLQVVATDQGADVISRRSTSVPIYIALEDVNDNAPVFSQKDYDGAFVSGIPLSPTSAIVQVFAEDKDEGVNALVIYKIVHGNEKGIFDINPHTGVIFPVKEMPDGLKEMNLIVQAFNQHTDLYDETTVRIQVLDTNRHKPKFLRPSLPNASVEIFENLAVANAVVLTVMAEDKDRGENGRISYFFKIDGRNVDHSDEFMINSVTGEIKTKKNLDRETNSEYQIVLVARDNGLPIFYETLSFLTVTLKDVNDNYPEFSRIQGTNPFVFTLKENLPRDHVVGRISAEDKDEGDNALIYYYIIDGNYGGFFTIEKTTGLIKSNMSYDRETRALYEIVVKATSNPDFTVYELSEDTGFSAKQRSYHEEDLSLALVRILIADVNDNPPVFIHEPYNKGIKKSTQPGDVILSVTAVDLDEGNNAEFEYIIENVRLYRPGAVGSVRPVPSPFNITSTGQLVSLQLMSRYDHSRFTINVIAKEKSEPFSVARSSIKLWIYEFNQLVRVVILQSPAEVNKKVELVHEVLSNAAKGTVVVDDIRYHINEKNTLIKEWTDLYIHVVDDKDEMAVTSKILESIDSNSVLMDVYQEKLMIQKVIPACMTLVIEEEYDLALLALISLFIALSVGMITAGICCMCLKKWYITRVSEVPTQQENDTTRGNTTENPLWTEQKLKLYEEQELSMIVSPDHPCDARQRQVSTKIAQNEDFESVMYATLKNVNGSQMGTFRQLQQSQSEVDVYATLNGCYSRVENSDLLNNSDQEENATSKSSTDPENHEYHELQCQLTNDVLQLEASAAGGLEINNKGEPVLITELL